ncbi:MAG TPA: YihY/virulence factor BrkB family protein [Candidatus Kapabacteria bacterium]|nr:YihY/virulence factor BrkB family protein [Candidatus Kapabacteria bacterium]
MLDLLIKLLKKRTSIGKIKETYKLIYNFIDILDSHHTFMLASGIAFTILIYVIPMLLVAIFILSKYVDINQINVVLNEIFLNFLPPTKSNETLLQAILSEVQNITEHSTFFGVIGIVGLLWISSTLINSIRVGLNTAFELKDKRIFILYRLKDILLTVLFSLLILIYSYGLPIVSFVIDIFGGALPYFIQEYYSETVMFFVSVITSFVIFYLIFRFVPNQRVDRKIRVIATAISVIGIEVSRHIFAYYLTTFATYGKFYGTYAIIISLAVWIYYSALIILLSAEISMYFLKHRQKV